ncbi:U4/U6 snRNA-associated-splicing factor PRP24 [Acrasis kona]|uniref:U4/U6 snRNA-associated-splicing factor PRP24 n=1 Tax=Acrasis kona TaxID=1008807 RepID=A0AAW2Z280_9EUKA
MSVTTSKALLLEKLNEIGADAKRLKKTIVVMELPFVADESDMKKYFSKCKGSVRSIDIYRSGALIFSSAIIEFSSSKGAQQAQELAMNDNKLTGEFDIVVMNATDFLSNKKPQRKKSMKQINTGNVTNRDNTAETSDLDTAGEKKCRLQ